MDESFVRCLAVLRPRRRRIGVVVDDESSTRITARRTCHVEGSSPAVASPHGTRDARVRGDAPPMRTHAVSPEVSGSSPASRVAPRARAQSPLASHADSPRTRTRSPRKSADRPPRLGSSCRHTRRNRRSRRRADPPRTTPSPRRSGVVPRVSNRTAGARDAYFVVVHSHVLRAPARPCPDGYVQRVIPATRTEPVAQATHVMLSTR